MVDLKRFAAVCGVVAPAIAMLALFVPTFLTPSFSWTGTSISHMGAEGMPAAFVLNFGLIAAGIVGLPFLWRVWIGSEHRLQRVGTVLFGLSVVGMIGVGVFPLPDPNHQPASLVHFLSYTFGLWTYGSGTVLAGRERWGLVTVWFGIAHVVSWIGLLLYVVLVQPATTPGIAIPETVGSVAFAAWLLVTARGYLADDGLAGGSPTRTTG